MPRGAKPGERRGGRAAGTPNKATASLREYAGKYTLKAIDGLVAIATSADTPPQARVSAYREILDRAVGKAPQAVTDADGNNLSVPQVLNFIVRQQTESDNRT